MSKSPAFQWYAADYLADERVMQLSLEAEGVYVRLLSYCWREGSIPANLALLPPLCKYADVKAIKSVLALFTKAGAPSGRLIHKRLEEERAKQEAHRAKQAENGRAGGRPRKATANPTESQNNPPLFFGETQTEPNESSSFSSSISSSFSTSPLPSVEDAASAAAPPAQEIETEELPAESPTPGLRTPGGAADVGTRVGDGQKGQKRGKKDISRPVPGSSNPADYQLPEWATTPFVEQFAAWLARRQARADCKPLQAQAVQARLTQLARYDEAFCLRLFEAAAQNPHWQGLTFDNTDAKFTQHCLDLQKLQANASRQHQPERGAKPTGSGALGARAAAEHFTALDAARAARGVHVVHHGAATGFNPS